MHTILIDTAALGGAAWQQTLQTRPMPRLSRLLRLAEIDAQEPEREDAEAAWLSPAERWMGVALGLQAAQPGGDVQQMPWGALAALGAGHDPGAQAWALALPAHLELGRESLSLVDPAQLRLEPSEAQALRQAVEPLLSEQGWSIEIPEPGTWLLAHPSLAEVRSADPVRAIGLNVASWMPSSQAARDWRRLLTEIQMVWQYHPVNEARAAAGRPQANTLWLHGAGVLPQGWQNPFVLRADDARAAWARAACSGLPRLAPSRHPHLLRLLQPQLDRLAEPQAMAQAIDQLDASAAEAVEQALRQHDAARVVLAGDRRWIDFELRRARRWQFWRRADAHVLLGLV